MIYNNIHFKLGIDEYKIEVVKYRCNYLRGLNRSKNSIF